MMETSFSSTLSSSKPIFSADLIASAVIDKFNELPTNFKPSKNNGASIHHWIPLAGIVLSGFENGANMRCVALGTGMKCLPLHKLPSAKGNVLHDWHAEIVALRAFNHFLMEELQQLMNGRNSSVVTFVGSSEKGDRAKRPFTIKPSLKIHMYCSEPPCGDASMEIVMSRQGDASPWPVPESSIADGRHTLLGRGQFSQLGIVRGKPCV